MDVTETDFEAFLDDISRCFFLEDYSLWRSRVRIPLCLALPTGLRILKTESEARRHFQACCTNIRAQQIDVVFRRPLGFDSCEDNFFLGNYETTILSGALRPVDPFESTVMLRWNQGSLVAGTVFNADDFKAKVEPKQLGVNRSAVPQTHGSTEQRYIQ